MNKKDQKLKKFSKNEKNCKKIIKIDQNSFYQFHALGHKPL